MYEREIATIQHKSYLINQIKFGIVKISPRINLDYFGRCPNKLPVLSIYGTFAKSLPVLLIHLPYLTADWAVREKT